MKNRSKRTKRKKIREYPTIEQLERVIRKERYRQRYGSVLRSTVYILITFAALAVLVATLWMPILQLYGSSMEPTLEEGEIVVSLKGAKIHKGDIIGFYYNNKLLVKRVIAVGKDVVQIDADGNVAVNDEPMDEYYISEKAVGDCDIIFPYEVPEDRYFVMGDNRGVSLDSRNSSVGCVSKDQIVGKLVFSIWPLAHFGKING